MIAPGLLVLFIFGGICLLIYAYLEGRKQRSEFNERLELVNPDVPKTVVAQGYIAPDAQRPKTAHDSLGHLLFLKTNHPWQLKTKVQTVIICAAIAAVMIWFLASKFIGLPFYLTIIATVLAAFLTARLLLAFEIRREEIQFATLFPDAVDTVARMLKAGLPVSSAFQTVGDEAPSPVNIVFAKIADQIRIGIPTSAAIEMSARQISLHDFRFFAAAVQLQQSTGGNLVSTLEAISNIMRKRRNVQKRAKALTAEVRFTAIVLSLLPFLCIGALLMMSPNYLTPLFDDPRGHIIIGLAVGCLSLALIVMRAMMRTVDVR